MGKRFFYFSRMPGIDARVAGHGPQAAASLPLALFVLAAQAFLLAGRQTLEALLLLQNAVALLRRHFFPLLIRALAVTLVGRRCGR